MRELSEVGRKTGAASGVLIALEEPTRFRRVEAADTGCYTSTFNGQKFPRIQLRTIEQLFDGKVIERPSWDVAVDETFKKAPKAAARKQGQQKDLGL